MLVLASLYLKQPDPSLVAAASQALADPSLADDSHREIKEDYNALFLVPLPPKYLPPFESAQRQGRLGGHLSRQIGSIYAAAGFDPQGLSVDAHWLSQPLPDHLGFELAFLGAVILHAQEGPLARVFLEMAQAFHHEHVRPWIERYGQRLESAAQTKIYQALGRATAGLAY